MSENVLPEDNSDNTESQISQPPRQEHPVSGRKVFFVNPPLYVENYLHLELKQHEYEVYIIPDYRYTKVALRNFPDALCFIFIDDGLSFDEWFNFVKSFQFDNVLKTIFIGLMSAVIPAQVKERFMLNLSLPGGFIMLNECKGSKLIEKIVGILDFNGAKGRRKYIRLDCENDVSINGYFANKSQLYQVTIVNISSVGFACFYPKTYGEALIKNSYVPSFSVTLGRRSIVTPSIVFDTRPYDEDRLFSVLLFVKQVGEDDRKIIKNFIFEQLQNRFESSVFSLPPDMDDYSNRNPLFSKKDSQNPPAPSDNSGENNSEENNASSDQEVKDLPEYIEDDKKEDSNNSAENTKMTGTSYDNPEVSDEI